ncbi:MAG: DUF4143 domain-containing protein [Proteobacteria bacterium]|nr:DUF4143 domain-containing protein [Pseudomonadota bacterium]
MMAVVERDIPQLGIGIPSTSLFHFWTMISHYHGLVWNAAPIAQSMGLSAPTVRRYLDLLEGVFMVRQLQPWHADVKKRQVKGPNVYIRDSIWLKQSHFRLVKPWQGFIMWHGYASIL